MKILALHNRYLIGGGEDQSNDIEIALLRQMGHQVDEFVEDNKRISKLGLIRTAITTIWSIDAYRRVRRQLHKNGYDLVIVQNTFPLLSPSVYYAAKSEKVPVIQFLRNYRSFCLNGLAYRDGKACVDCLGKCLAWPGIYHACYHDSKLGSSTVAFMLLFHKLIHTWQRKVNCFIALSQFSKELSIRAGIPAKKIIVKPNFVLPDPGIGDGAEGFALFVGRLSTEKGILPFLQTWLTIQNIPKLVLVGDGPLQFEIEKIIKGMPSIIYLGKKSPEEVLVLMKKAMCLVFPSLCYEGMPRTVIESFAVGTPVLATGIGATREMIISKKNGLLYDSNDPADLARQLNFLMTNPEKLKIMRQGARESFETSYSISNNLLLWQKIQDFITNTRDD